METFTKTINLYFIQRYYGASPLTRCSVCAQALRRDRISFTALYVHAGALKFKIFYYILLLYLYRAAASVQLIDSVNVAFSKCELH